MALISLNLEAPASRFRNQGGTSTFASPSEELVHALVGLPAAAGKVVTKETAIRVAAFLAGVKMLSNDIAKMPLILRQTQIVGGRQRTYAAIDNALYSILKDVPNQWQTSYQMRWFLASQLVMNSNCYCQKITDQSGELLSLIPLNAWGMHPHWDSSNTATPQLLYRYTWGNVTREFTQDEIWHTSVNNLEGNGLEGSSILLLAKEALSVLMAAEETAGRNFANGLGMGGFISFPPDSGLTETEAQNVVDRLKKDFSGSQNAAKFTILPGGGKWEKMTFNAQESQLLESRKWNEQEVVRLLGGAPLLVKLGLGEQNSTYAASSAFLDEYFNTSLLPYTTAIEQSITRDLIPRKQWGSLYAKHSADIILRGSPKERAETNSALILSWQLTPNEARLLEDRDTIDGGDFLSGPANGAIFNPTTGEFFIPGQLAPDPGDPDADEPTTSPDADEPDDAGDSDGDTDPPAAAAKPSANAPSKATARLHALAASMADRVLRKEQRSAPDAKFTAEVMNVDLAAAEVYVATRSDLNDDQARTALIALAVGAHMLKPNRFFNAATSNGTLTMDMYDFIGADMFGEGITEAMVSNALRNSDSKSVTLNINSPGGDAFAGVAIRNVLAQSNKQVNVNVVGLAASAASIVAMAGDKITMHSGSVMMIHPAQSLAMGDATEMRKMADTLDTVTNSIADVYVAKTGLDKDTVLSMMNAETWMNAAEAVANGFATSVSKEQAAVKNEYDLSIMAYKKAPAELQPIEAVAKTKEVDGENLTAGDFVYVGNPDDTSTWSLPWHFSTDEKTKSHLRDALARFDQDEVIPAAHKDEAWAKLLRLCSEHGIDVSRKGNPKNEAEPFDMLPILAKQLELSKRK